MSDPQSRRLSFGEIVVLIVTILLVVVPMNATSRTIFLLVALGFAIHLTWRSPWTVKRERPYKTGVTVILVMVCGGISAWLFATESRESVSTTPHSDTLVSSIRSWGAARVSALSSLPWRWVWLGAAAGFLAALLFGRRSRKDAPAEPDTIIKDCGHGAELARLQDQAQLHYVRAELRENDIKHLQETYAAAIEKANYQASRIDEFVEVIRACTYEAKLDDDLPTIRWGLLFKNNSLFRITLDGEIGPPVFEGKKLLEAKEVRDNEVSGLWPDRQGLIVFEQRLSPSEAELLKRRPNGMFEFDKVTVQIKGYADDRVKSQRLVIPPEFRANLGKCSDFKSQATAEIEAERDALKLEIETLREHELVLEVATEISELDAHFNFHQSGMFFSEDIMMFGVGDPQEPNTFYEAHANLYVKFDNRTTFPRAG